MRAEEAANISFKSDTAEIILSGNWNTAHIAALESEITSRLQLLKDKLIYINGSGIKQFDTAGAWLLQQICEYFNNRHIETKLIDFSDKHQKLLRLIKSHLTLPPKPVKPLGFVGDMGYWVMDLFGETKRLLSFVGELTFTILFLLRHPKQIRWRAVFNIVENTGAKALSIIALLSFLIGVVLAYEMGLQLENYGANIFIVDLMGLAILREFAPLLAAIIIAGRSGSAFTAQLGLMKSNQEVDALQTLGISPLELLAAPRIIGLVIAMPLVTIWSGAFGVLGGMVMSKTMFSINYADFIRRFGEVVELKSLVIGLCKSPIFAALIATVGCFQGFQVTGSAESIGWHTTKSVVQSIFLIIVADAIISILLSMKGI